MEKVNVLGTEYKIIREEMKDAEYDGYCDYTSKIIKLRTDNVNKLGDFDCLMKKQLRHEITAPILRSADRCRSIGLGPSSHPPGYDILQCPVLPRTEPRKTIEERISLISLMHLSRTCI